MIDPVFNMYKVKFSVLDTLNPLDKTKNRIRIFINLEMVLKTLITPKNSNQLQASNDATDVKLSIISNIVNLAQHYRLYCIKHGLESEVYIYFNYPHDMYYNCAYITDYRAYYINRILKNENANFLVSGIAHGIEFLQVLGKYVDSVYIVHDGKIESSVIPYIISENSQCGSDCQNIIVSNSKYDIQYVNYGFTIISPFGDTSSIITKNTALTLLKAHYDSTIPIVVPPVFIPFIISLLGDKYRCIPKIRGVGITSILKIIQAGIDTKTITPNTSNMTMLGDLIKPEYRDLFDKNYQCVDIPIQYNRLSGSDIQRIIGFKEDNFDENMVHKINESYFQQHPLMIINPKSEQIRKDEYSGKSIFS